MWQKKDILFLHCHHRCYLGVATAVWATVFYHSLVRSVTLGPLGNLSVPQFFIICKVDMVKNYFLGVLWGMRELTCAKGLGQCLDHRKPHGDVNYLSSFLRQRWAATAAAASCGLSGALCSSLSFFKPHMKLIKCMFLSRSC